MCHLHDAGHVPCQLAMGQAQGSHVQKRTCTLRVDWLLFRRYPDNDGWRKRVAAWQLATAAATAGRVQNVVCAVGKRRGYGGS
jgi:hypothetical protein